MNPRHSIADPNYSAADEARDRRREASLPLAEPPDALKAAKCQCDNKHTYRDEDGERRCLCGRGI